MDGPDRLLESLLGSLDRLYDGHCTPADVGDLCRATAAALTDRHRSAVLLDAADAISAYKWPVELDYADALTDPGWQSHALTVTDELRQLLAGEWS